MSGPRWVRGCAPILLGAGLAQGAVPPAGSVAASGSVTPAGLIMPVGSAPNLASLPAISGASIPAEPSSAPKAAEWDQAAPVRINRGDQGTCSAALIREWLRLRCPTWIGGGLTAGDPKGVTITAFGDPFSDPEGPNGSQNRAVTTMVLPILRGEAKVVTFLQLGEEYNSSAYAEGGTLSVVWRSGRPDPVLVMTQRPAPTLR